MSDKLVLTRTALDSPKNLSEVFELTPFRAAFANNYLKTTGKAGGEMIFEREKLLFLRALESNKKLADCDRFTIYSSFIELAVSGLSLIDGQSFIIPYGKKAQFQIGWKGRLEQIQQIPAVKWVNTPILVWESEVDAGRFDYEYLEGATTIIQHKPILKRPEGDQILFAYVTIETFDGIKTHLMDREAVLSIRDRYSQPYKSYIAACLEAKVEVGKPITKQGQFGPYTIEPPFWVTDEGQAFKKTVVKRMYSELPKTARMKALDAKIETNYDPETATGGDAETHDIDYGIAGAETADQQLPEKTAEKKEVKEPRKKTAAATPASVTQEVKEPEPETIETTATEAEEANPVNDLPDLNNI